MNELGERLREARESQGISISQAAVETRILQRYLVALEDGDYQHLPGDVYARGFIRNYADYLSSPADELIELYRRERGMSEPIRVVPATSSPRMRGLVLPSFFGVFFVVLVLVGGSYLALSALNFVGESSRPDLATVPTSAPTPLPLPTPAPEPSAQPQVAAVRNDADPWPGRRGDCADCRANRRARCADPGRGQHRWRRQPRLLAGDQSTARRSSARCWAPVSRCRLSKPSAISGSGAGNAAVVFVVINGQKQCCTASSGEVQTFSWPPR